MDIKKRTLLLPVVAVAMALVFPQVVFATARVLERDFTVNDTWSYTCDTTCVATSGAKTATVDLDYTLSKEVTADNQDGSFDIDVDQSDMSVTFDTDPPESLTARSSAETIMTPSGKNTTLAAWNTLLNFNDLSDDGTWDWGSIADNNGLFVTTAVEENDTWYVSHTVTPYGQSPEEVVVTATLLEWTTKGGYNVGKIKYEFTDPVRSYNSTDGAVIEGEIDNEMILYYAYSEKKIVQCDITATGTNIVYTVSGDDYDMDLSITLSHVLN